MSKLELLSNFLKNTNSKTVTDDTELFIRINYIIYNEFITEKFISLYNIYKQISQTYNDMSQFMAIIENSILKNENDVFKDFSLFDKFYYLYKFLFNIILKDDVPNLKVTRNIRITECLARLNINKDIAKVVNKYDFYAYGFKKYFLNINASDVISLKDGRFATYENNTVNIYNPVNANIDMSIENKDFTGMYLFERNNGDIVISSINGGYILDISNGQLLQLEIPPGQAHIFGITNNDKFIAGLFEGDVIIWDLNTRKIQFVLETRPIQSIMILLDNRIILYMRQDEIQLWNEGKLIFKGDKLKLLEVTSQDDTFLRAIFESHYYNIKFLPNDRILRLSQDNLFLKQKDRPERLLLKNVKYMDILPNGDLLVTRGLYIEIWNIENMKLQFSRIISSENIHKLVALKNGYILYRDNTELTIWE